MKHLKLILSIIFSIFITLSVSACSKNDDDDFVDNTEFVGIAFYQKAEENNYYSRYKKNPAQINDLIVTRNNEIAYTEKIDYLFYFYCKNKISSSTKSSDFLSNTTASNFKIENNSLSLSIERISEPTDVLIYFIYKNEDGSYKFSFQKEVTNLNAENTEIELEISNEDFSKIHLTLSTNLTSSKNY